MFYRTEEQLALFRDPNWVRDVIWKTLFPGLISKTSQVLLKMVTAMCQIISPVWFIVQLHLLKKKLWMPMELNPLLSSTTHPKPWWKKEVPYYPLWTNNNSELVHLLMLKVQDTVTFWKEYVPRLVPRGSPEEFEDIWERLRTAYTSDLALLSGGNYQELTPGRDWELGVQKTK